MSAPEHTERHATKLEMAHVLFMDIVGYSKLPMDHQEAVLRTLQEVVSATAEFLRAQASHEMIRLPTGDGMALVFFEDAEAAARCALEVSRVLKSHPEVPLRMGLHSGPVYRVTDINANQNVAGGGINIAQRVMDCGDAGHILASQSVADVLGQLSIWKASLYDLGDAEVKHGVRVHLYNLYTNEAGNSALPKKVAASKPVAEAGLKPPQKSTRFRGKIATAATILVIGLAVGGWLFFSRKAHALTDKDTIVLADFTNTTGDAVFDGTLRQGLAVQLEQSPFLSIVSDQQIQQTLQMMGQKPDAKLTPEIAQELCQRTGSAAVLAGSITQIGTPYLLTLKAVNCGNGESLASTEVQASDKSHVLDALGKTASDIRGNLGESLSTVQKFDTPLERATTSSLEALQAYSLGVRTKQRENDDVAALAFFQQAINLDPNFAMAHAMFFGCYADQGEPNVAFEHIRKAFELRDRVSEKEKFFIESGYHSAATGDLEKEKDTVEVWARTFPRDPLPPNRLGILYDTFGQYDKGLSEFREALRLLPDSGLEYCNVVYAYRTLNRLEEARATAAVAKEKNLDLRCSHTSLYEFAFLENDSAGMAEQVAWSAGKAGLESQMFFNAANTAAYFGRLKQARENSRHAVASALSTKRKELAARYEAMAALREALYGNAAEAPQHVASSLGLSEDTEDQYGAALALVLAGHTSRAQALTDDMGKRYPEDTMVQYMFLPTLHAQVALNGNDTSKAIEILRAAALYELGDVGFTNLYPVFIRGNAYLAAHQGNEAAVEFQKILDHRAVVFNEPIGALAHLQIGRAYAMQGDTVKAHAAYQDFLTLWKDADPDIPVFIAAKAEYAKLK
jgi:class 3 adenylate cyclase/tetratricopeptide (TPR) repeat protein